MRGPRGGPMRLIKTLRGKGELRWGARQKREVSYGIDFYSQGALRSAAGDVRGDLAALADRPRVEARLRLEDGEELQVDRTAVAISVAHVRHQRADGRFDAQFFFELANQGLFRTFTRFHFAAGKLPFQGHGLVGAALANQDLVATENESGDDVAHGPGFRGPVFL